MRLLLLFLSSLLWQVSSGNAILNFHIESKVTTVGLSLENDRVTVLIPNTIVGITALTTGVAKIPLSGANCQFLRMQRLQRSSKELWQRDRDCLWQEQLAINKP
jgi:hypothetical protein